MSQSKAIFLDRDGTVIRESHYLCEKDAVEFEIRALDALRLLLTHEYQLFIVTNQSGIGRGYFTETDYLSIQNYIHDLLSKASIPITKTFYCPHHPTEAKGQYLKNCKCRKPKPGMIIEALSLYPDIDPAQSFMIGDQLTDVQSGQNAGLQSILVRTGKGQVQSQQLEQAQPDFIADHLYDAVVNFIL